MTRSIMEMTDEILNGALSETGSSVQKDEPELPELSDDQRASMLNESLSEGVIPFDPDARKQHTAQGMSKNTLGRKKPKKTMGTPPGFEKTPEEKEAAAKKPENASLYPRITIKAESRERTRRGNEIRAAADRRRRRDGTGSTEASRAQGAADFAKRDAARKAERSASIAAANQATRDADAKRKAGQTLDPRTGKPRTDGGPTAQNSSITRKQHAVLKEALSILKEVTSVGGIGMGGSANKCYDADAKPMGKDNVPIKGVDASLKKMVKKGSKNKKMVKKGSKNKKMVKKGSEKVGKKTSKKDEKEMENSSFSRFLDGIVNETLKN